MQQFKIGRTSTEGKPGSERPKIGQKERFKSVGINDETKIYLEGVQKQLGA